MLTVYHLGISQSERIVWLCEELQIPYELIRFDRDPITGLAPEAYKTISPTGTAPVIHDGNVVLDESGAIIEYIITRYGQGRLSVSPEEQNYPDYLFWFHYANASFMPMEMIRMVLKLIDCNVDNKKIKFVEERLSITYNLLEKRLGENAYLTGNHFTAADLIMFFPLTTMRIFIPKDLSPYPNIRAYLQQVGTRPAYQRAMRKADPDLKPLLS